ncbi:translation initiation factor 2, partial [Pseudoflavonifractor phocaeensis]|nr:translation initiation factor 2 [Pseudoflavonifractor phocaeensis]
RDFVLGLIEQALAEAEASLAPQEAPEGSTPDASEASTEAERDTADIEQ